MTNGKVARVLIFEHSHSISLEGWIDSFPEHSDADEPRIKLPFYDIMLGQATLWYALCLFRSSCKPARLTTNVITEHRHLLFTDAHLAGFTVGPTHLYAPVAGTDRPIYTYY